MKLEAARTIALEWVERLKPFTTRIEIAGSIRRCKPEVKDIEIVCIPAFDVELDLLLFEISVNKLNLYIERSGVILTKNGDRYKQIVTLQDIKIDLFIVLPPSQWGVQFLIRTGSAAYSHRFVTPRKHGGMLPSNMVVKNGCIWLHGQPIETPEEEDVYRLIGLPWIPPQERIA